jgi:glycerophosphoryl diester phosphodiesterase
MTSLARLLARGPGREGQRPLVIAHRGASGHLPEHTLESYRLAIELGADYVEPDLVATRDGVLVARHENEISGTTDVARRAEFADRQTVKLIDGELVAGWFTEDFTLAEIKTLRATERLPGLRGRTWDGQFTVPTLHEILGLVLSAGQRAGRVIGVYPETKHPTYFRSLGLPLEEPLLAALASYGLDHPGSPVFIQSFETANLRALHEQTPLPLIQLLDCTGQPYDFTESGDRRSYADLAATAGLAQIRGYATGIGVHKDLVTPRDGFGRLLGPTALIPQAHRLGLAVHVWTLRSENEFLPACLRRGSDPAAHGDATAEHVLFRQLGADGIFTDFPGTAVTAFRAASGGAAPGRPGAAPSLQNGPVTS